MSSRENDDSQDERITNLEQLLERISDSARQEDRISLEEIMDSVGHRSFGPLLLLAGLVMVIPVIGDIPGVPIVMGTLVLLVSVQLLVGRDYFWLPRWLLKRSIARDKLCKAVGWMQRPARFLDRFLRKRLGVLTHDWAVRFIAVACALIALSTPALEMIPFSANLAGAAFMGFGLALIAHDGLLALLAFIATAATFGVVAYGIW